jgi:hypothetical protein
MGIGVAKISTGIDNRAHEIIISCRLKDRTSVGHSRLNNQKTIDCNQPKEILTWKKQMKPTYINPVKGHYVGWVKRQPFFSHWSTY